MLRDELSFAYLIMIVDDGQELISEDMASDYAYEYGLLFNTIKFEENHSIELVIRTLRTRISRLISE